MEPVVGVPPSFAAFWVVLLVGDVLEAGRWAMMNYCAVEWSNAGNYGKSYFLVHGMVFGGGVDWMTVFRCAISRLKVIRPHE
jgi:hypothetical protein